MPTQGQQFIYTFDECENKFIALNTRTGQRVDRLDEGVRHLLGYFKKHEDELKLREFVLGCASATNYHLKAVQKQFFELAIADAFGKDRKDHMHHMYQQTEREAIAVDSAGLKQKSSKAAAFLISRECVNPHIYEAAVNAARFHSLWTKLRYAESKPPMATAEPEFSTCLKVAADQQVNLLLELMET